ncbi:MAG: hypothetical protein KIS81_07450 [Maricaulaceae bacterium]|nr:hypothetical protein [Maricaulaceae bacterium]
MTVRVCLWSGPRNISTAMMRAWENRPDTEVWDEPFYAHYLHATGIDHPGRGAVIAAGETNWRTVAAACAGDAPGGPAIFFQKHMCQHMLDHIDRGWMADCRHVFLIRDPAEVAASFHAAAGEFTAADLGAERQLELFETAERLTGRRWPVVEGADVLENPRGMLAALCAALQVPFREQMLSWPAGRRDSDGVWAPHWYARVEASTGFEKPRPSPHVLPEALRPQAEACRPHYEALKALKLTPENAA